VINVTSYAEHLGGDIIAEQQQWEDLILDTQNICAKLRDYNYVLLLIGIDFKEKTEPWP